MSDQIEANTRITLFDPKLIPEGWSINDSTQVGLEIPVDGNAKARYTVKEQLERIVNNKNTRRQAEELFKTLLHWTFRGELSEERVLV